MEEKYNEVVVNTTSIFCIIYLFIIYLINIGVTSDITYTTDYSPYQYLDIPLMHLCMLPIITFFITKFQKINIEEKIINRLFIGISIITFITLGIYSGFLFADPEYSMNAARGFMGNEKYKSFSSTYPASYPYQSAYIIYLMPICKIFGYFDYLIITLSSVILFTASLYLIRKVFKILLDDEYNKTIDLSLIFFIPGWLLSEFGYNDIPGLFFTILGFYLYLTSKESKKKIILSILITSIGLAIRKNYLILLIAFFIITLFDKENKKSILYFIGSIVLYKIIASGSYEILKMMNPEILNFEKNYETTRWLYIGLSESDTGAGYWAPNTAVSENVNNLFSERIGELLSNPIETMSFFLKKLANTYSAPDYDTIDAFRHKDTLIINREMTKNFFYNRNMAYSFVYFILNLFQPLIYVGNILYILLNKKKTTKKCFGLIFFTGLLLFYTIWEVKARYVLIGTLFLIPTAVIGLQEIEKIKFEAKNGIYAMITGLMVVVLSTFIGNHIVNDEINMKKLNSLNERMEYLYENDIGKPSS